MATPKPFTKMTPKELLDRVGEPDAENPTRTAVYWLGSAMRAATTGDKRGTSQQSIYAMKELGITRDEALQYVKNYF